MIIQILCKFAACVAKQPETSVYVSKGNLFPLQKLTMCVYLIRNNKEMKCQSARCAQRDDRRII